MLICFCLVSSSVWAQAQNESNYIFSGKPQQQEIDEQVENCDSEETWQELHDQLIYDNYGCEDSPAFLNRENINPHESDYEYGSSDGNY